MYEDYSKVSRRVSSNHQGDDTSWEQYSVYGYSTVFVYITKYSS